MRTHRLADLLPHRYRTAASSIVCKRVVLDSRQVRPGDVFVALPGSQDDGKRYLADARRRGAVAAIAEGAVTPASDDLPIVAVDDVRATAGHIADHLFDFPSAQLSVIGITGTNGKTSVSWLVAQLLTACGHRCAVLGTLGFGVLPEVEPTTLTTGDVFANHEWLAKAVLLGARFVAMEVSSHALDQQRVAGVRFSQGVFTNLSRDHLDYHGSMQAYADAKRKLFVRRELAGIVVNEDDDFGRTLADAGASVCTRFGRAVTADVRVLEASVSALGIRGLLGTATGTVALRSQLVGAYNVSNLTAAVAVALQLGIDVASIEAALPTLRAVPGRMQLLSSGDGVVVVVDYAHTPDGLEKALAATRALTSGTLTCVFGCGGNRDAGKRPLMAATVESGADRIVLTNDNPRHEDPEHIFADVMAGASQPNRWCKLPARAEAIRKAVLHAKPGDAVLVAGKGHETYQEIAGVRHNFSDAECCSAALRERA